MLRLPDSWVWDFWLADDGDRYHLFFLYASRALPHPDDRHYRASIGHAVSDDLVNWDRVVDALVPTRAPAFDDLATWTGSVVRHPDGTWFLFYTGGTLDPGGKNVQRIGLATSPDLLSWTRYSGNPVLEAESRWYEKVDSGCWHDEAFRDPWVFADPNGNGWHMLITARSTVGPAFDRGVVGHAWSADLWNWEARPPLSEPGAGFGQMEVTQVEIVDGRPFLLFSTGTGELAERRRNRGETGGVWIAEAASLLGPFDVEHARRLGDPSLYSGKLVQRRDSGDWCLMAFRNTAGDGGFGGEIIDPLPLVIDAQTLLPTVGDRAVAP